MSEVEEFLKELDSADSVASDLGTPVPAEPDAMRRLLAMGPAIVPELLEQVRGDAPKKRAAYVALLLRMLGDTRAIAALRELRAAYQEHEHKDEWDYAVIGQCNLAIEALKARAG